MTTYYHQMVIVQPTAIIYKRYSIKLKTTSELKNLNRSFKKAISFKSLTFLF